MAREMQMAVTSADYFADETSIGAQDDESPEDLGDSVGELLHLCANGRAEECMAVEEWLETHPNTKDRIEAANLQGEFDMKALHFAARNGLPPSVIKGIIACCPDVVRDCDSFGWHPIHYACANHSVYVLDIVSILYDAYPQSLAKQDHRGRTALHFFFGNTSVVYGSEAVELVCQLITDTGVAHIRDQNGMLPMHYACAFMVGGGSYLCKVLKALQDSYPVSIVAQDKKGRTPLHLALANADRGASPEVLRFLLLHGVEHNIISIRDNEGTLALELMKNRSEALSNDYDARTNLQECLPIIIDALQDLPDEGFIVLQSLPPWLQAEAFKNPGYGLQSALNAHISMQFPTMILMLDFYFSVALIACFQLVSTISIDCIFGNQALPNASLSPSLEMVLICGIYFLLREVTQIISLGSAGLLKRVWMMDATNLIDVTSIAVTFMWYGLIRESCESREDASKYSKGREWYRTGMALTIGLYWLSFLLLLRATSPSFAVFMSGMLHVMRSLAMFLICLGITLLAFAQMFFTVFRETSFCQCQEEACVRDPVFADGTSFCTFRESLLQVYFMLAGEFDPYVVTFSAASTFLACVFIFLAVILLLNVLIAIVTNAYIFVQDSSANVFWSQRFAFLAEVRAITVFLTRGCSKFGRRDRNPGQESSELQLHKYETKKRELWSKAILIFYPDRYDAAELSCCETIVYFVVGIFVFFVLVLWVLAGLVTAGLLWPPQIREFLLQQHICSEERGNHTNSMGTVSALTDYVTKDQYQLLKDEMSEVKKQNEEISQQNAEIKELLVSVLNHNAKEVTVRLDSSEYAPI